MMTDTEKAALAFVVFVAALVVLALALPPEVRP